MSTGRDAYLRKASPQYGLSRNAATGPLAARGGVRPRARCYVELRCGTRVGIGEERRYALLR